MDLGHIDIDNLTKRQKEVYRLLMEGNKQAEIARILGCSKQNVNTTLKIIKKNAENPKAEKNPKNKIEKPKAETGARKTAIETYEKYKEADFSVLSKREREVIELRISGKTNRQIADELGISINNVWIYLERARAKLDGRKTAKQKWYEANRDKVYEKNKQNSKYLEYSKTYSKKYYKERTERFKEYNRQYYLENRERILEQQKQRRLRIKQERLESQ